MERWAPGATVSLGDPGGLELLTVKGGFTEGGEAFSAQSWIRLPKGGLAAALAGPEGAQVWIKRGHLAGEIIAPA